ncbi:MAG TPA: lysine--tRNA ligase [Patescibacteria group bacterium]
MFWADQIALEIKKRNKPLEWVDDAKTPSGKIHVGSLRGVVIHDLIYKCLLDIGVNAKYTYIFEDQDPMDGLPVYLPKEKFEKYLGLPLFKVPSPEEGYKSFAHYYAEDFKKVFNAIGSEPEIIWGGDLYRSGKMNPLIKEALDKADDIKKIYEEIYKKDMPEKWYPFQPYCTNCGKVSTTTVTDWDGEQITFTCEENKVKFTKGCGFTGKMSPFSGGGEIVGKLTWKIEWPAKWKVIGVTVEGAGKDHMTAGGSHDVASKISDRVFNYPVPFPLAYEWFILGKQKMSTSKGVGASAADMLDILPPQVLRFLMVRTKINSEINFDLSNPNTIPQLFDEYQRYADAYFNNADADLARTFQLSQIGEVQKPPTIRFSVLAQWVQMPNMEEEIKKQGLENWATYARFWVEKYAPESDKFVVQKELPESAKNLSEKQKAFLQKVVNNLDNYSDAEKLQFDMYEWGKEMELSGKEVFGAIYLSLLGKQSGPKAAWLILSLDKNFVKNRFTEVSFQESKNSDINQTKNIIIFDNPKIFSIDKYLFEKVPSISVGVAVIRGVQIEKTNPELEKEKQAFLSTIQNVTTEELGKFEETVSYRKLYKEMGVDWHSRRPSPEALLRRIALGKGLYTINTCVDAYNMTVMKHKVSVGAFDLDTIAFPTVLRFAKNGEEILLLGDEKPTAYTEKEIAYFDQNGGYNMDFNYRDAQRTAVQLHTKNILLNVDGVYAITPEEVQTCLQEACDMIIKYCGGTIESFGVVANI